jgi:phage terminase large subunit-like protein
VSAALRQLEEELAELNERVEESPLPWMDWTIRQWEFAELVAGNKLALFRAGNQVGKTIIGAALTISRCLGVELATGRKAHVPIEAWVVCTTWSQAVAIMHKVWALAPKGELEPGQICKRRTGFGKENPALIFKNGSIIRFKTTKQGADAIAGATVDWVWIDEPTDIEMYRELQKRVMRREGTLIITLTPVNRPCEWLHDLVDRGAVKEVHAPLDRLALTFRGSGERMRLLSGRPMDDDWIAEERTKTPAMFAPVVLDGEWEMRPEGVFFHCWDATRHIKAAVRINNLDQNSVLSWRLGMDYAAADRDFGQVAVLCRVLQVKRKAGWMDAYVHVVDEVVLSGIATTDQFADELMSMLARNNITWRDLTTVHGDNPVTSQFSAKGNQLTLRAVARRVGVPFNALKPTITSAKDGPRQGSLRHPGSRWVFAQLVMQRLWVHPRCKHLIKAFEVFDYSEEHPYKDVIDALRYGLKPVIFRFGSNAQGTIRTAA